MMRTARKIFPPAFVGGAIICCATADKKQQKKARLTAHSVYRIGNLLSTTTIMCVDYGLQHLYHKSRKLDVLGQKQEQLLEIQQNMENLNILLLNPPTGNLKRTHQEDEKLRNSIIKVRSEMDRVTCEITELVELGNCKKSEIHTRNAKRLTQMCAENGGLYIKLGQHIAMLDYIVPLEYRDELSVLLGTTPQSSFESVSNVIEEELGNSPVQIFDQFEPTPIASASLAQVHKAWKDGKAFAVKVQHDGLAESSFVDMLVITALVDFVHKLFPEFDYVWLTKEMNVNLPLELNFRNEKMNIEKTSALLKTFIERGDVAIPSVEAELSGVRVLTMSFEDGCYITRQDKMKEWNLNKTEIAETIAKVFSEQIFRHGFVHCDPHEANMLVRRNPLNANRSQIVLLDHGQYRLLGDQFRRDYCRLWQGVALGRGEQIEHYCKSMKAGDLYTLLAAMITQRPWDDIVSKDIDRLKSGKIKAADSVMLQAYTQRYLDRIVQLLAIVPSDLLLLFKTNDCLRHLDGLLSSTVNSSAVAAKVSGEVILQEDLKEAHDTNSWSLFIIAYYDYCSLQMRLTGYNCYSYWWSRWQ